ncbi:hypothetical protein [Arthrobacter sp. SLBN-53]|nr:hypothetical protein [Arthrobacter sp. SLBN-53]TQK29397.1 hypothetical protein FBY28_2400 [Arthrobacter sp. SLBN-53]
MTIKSHPSALPVVKSYWYCSGVEGEPAELIMQEVVADAGE